jgi:hypothetical protein
MPASYRHNLPDSAKEIKLLQDLVQNLLLIN